MKDECLHLLGDGAFLREDKELTYEEHKSGKDFNFLKEIDYFNLEKNKINGSDVSKEWDKVKETKSSCEDKKETLISMLTPSGKTLFVDSALRKIIDKVEKPSCERKFKVGDIVTVVNHKSVYLGRTFEIIDYDDFDEFYILENAVGYKDDDLELYIGQSMAEKRFSVGNFIAVANSKLENYNKVLSINEINGNDVKLSDGSVVFWTDIEMFQEEETKSSCEEFMKFDSLKPNLAILFDTGKALEDVANVMSYGAKKYDRKNWSKVDNKERYISAPLRHIAAYCSGEKIDPESGLPHLACAITSLLFLQEIERNEDGNN